MRLHLSGVFNLMIKRVGDKIIQNPLHLSTSTMAAVLVLSLWSSFVPYSFAFSETLTILGDQELAAIEAKGFYFRMDMSIEAFTDGSTAPQIVTNTGTPIVTPTDTTTGSFQAPLGSISLSGSAQSNVSSLVNVIGATSVINVGVNIVSIQNSSNDTIYTSNVNTGAQGANFAITLSLAP